MSDIVYTPVGWEDSPSTNTPINEANLGNMEQGIEDAIDGVNASIPSANILPLEDLSAVTESGKYVADAMAVKELNSSLTNSFTNNLTDFIRVVECSSSSQTISINLSATYSFDSYVPSGYTSILCVPKLTGTNYGFMVIGTLSRTSARAVNHSTSSLSFAMQAYLICVKSEFLS